MDNHEDDTIGEYRLNRRSALAALGAGVGTVAGIGAFSGTAAAWEFFEVEFKGCSEVWMMVGDRDVTFDPPAVAHVIVQSGGEAVCREVQFTEENATTVPGQHGDTVVVKYAPGGDDKVLGAIEYNYTHSVETQFDRPTWCVHVNTNRCATILGTPSVHDAPCIPEDHPVCPSDESSPGRGNGGVRGNGQGPP